MAVAPRSAAVQAARPRCPTAQAAQAPLMAPPPPPLSSSPPPLSPLLLTAAPGQGAGVGGNKEESCQKEGKKNSFLNLHDLATVWQLGHRSQGEEEGK